MSKTNAQKIWPTNGQFDLSFPAGTGLVIHTSSQDYPARVEHGSPSRMTVTVWPLGKMDVRSGPRGTFLVDTRATGAQEKVLSITAGVPYKYENPGRQHLSCGDLSPKKCRQRQDIYESARSRGYSKERSAKQAMGVTSNPELATRVRKLKS